MDTVDYVVKQLVRLFLKLTSLTSKSYVLTHPVYLATRYVNLNLKVL